MKSRFGVFLLLLGLLAPEMLLGAEKKKPAPPPAIARLAWLTGNWRLEKDNRVVDEQWMVPAGGVMLGMGRTVVKGKAVEHEFLQIREGPGGALFYIAQSSGRKEAAFQVKSLTDATVIFENQLQDFPQKITYTLQSDGSLLTAFDGPSPDGQPKHVEFLYQRINR